MTSKNSEIHNSNKTGVKQEFKIEANLIGILKTGINTQYSNWRTLHNSKITIKTGVFSSYILNVEGASGSLKVKPVK